MLTAKDVFDKVSDAALAATDADERPLQIDYPALEQKILQTLGERKVKLVHVNQFLPEGYEDQGRLNALVLTAGGVLFDLVVGDNYFRYDIFSCRDLDKIQMIDGTWDNTENKTQDAFLSLRLMHGDEAHILLALKDEQRPSVLTFASALGDGRHPEDSRT